MNAENKQTASESGQKSRTSKPTGAIHRPSLELSAPIKTELLNIPKSALSPSCELISELPFPWNGAFLECQKELHRQTEHRVD